MPLWTPPLYHPGYVAGRYYATVRSRSPAAAITAIDLLYVYPFPIFSTILVKTLAARVTTAGTASAIKMGIYADHPTLHRPTGAPLIADNTGVATTSNNTTAEADVTDTILGPGWYWAANKHTGTLPSMVGVDAADVVINLWGGTTNNPTARPLLSIADTYSNALPTTFNGADSWTESSSIAAAIFLGL